MDARHRSRAEGCRPRRRVAVTRGGLSEVRSTHMSQQSARAFVQWLANHPGQRNALLGAQSGQRRTLLESAGFGDVTQHEVDQVLQAGAAADLSDEQLRSIQGGLRVAAITWD